MPWPPPMHCGQSERAALAREKLRRLAGDAGTGPPQRMAERQRPAVAPTRASSKPSSRATAGAWTAKASLPPRSSGSRPRACCSAPSGWREPGPMPMIVGSQPATAVARMRASTFRPWAPANSSLTTSTAGGAVGERRRGAGRHRSLRVEGLQGRQLLGGGSARMQPSVTTRPPSAFRWRRSRRRAGRRTAPRRPSGGSGRRSSCSAREMPYLAARFSAVMPIAM